MTKQKKINVLVLDETTVEAQWLESSLLATSLNIKTHKSSSLKEFKLKDGITEVDITEKLNKIDLCVISENLFKRFFRLIKTYFSFNQMPFPFLVMTNDYKIVPEAEGKVIVCDVLAKPGLTLPLLTHSILSVLRDFKLSKSLSTLAHFDQLTSSANRQLFNDRLEQALSKMKRYKESFTVIYLDLDKFKHLNDTYGHDFGDEVLKKFAILVRSCIRESDTLARLGGDEFALILPKADTMAAIQAAEKLLNVLSKAHNIKNIDVQIEVSIGITSVTYENNRQLDSDAVLKRADIAVYDAKTSGRNKYCVFNG